MNKRTAVAGWDFCQNKTFMFYGIYLVLVYPPIWGLKKNVGCFLLFRVPSVQ